MKGKREMGVADIRRVRQPNWENYHRTLRRAGADLWHFLPHDGGEPIAALSRSAAALQQVLRTAAERGETVQPLGASWSFSDLLKGEGALFNVRLSDRIFALSPGRRGPAAMHDGFFLVHAGTTIGELNKALEPVWSLATSGAHDGQTIAGAMGTGTHGSAVDQGGFQNHIRGIHVVTGPDSGCWVERGPTPFLLPDAAHALAGDMRLDAELFDALLVHLGALGLINAVLIEAVPGFTVDVVTVKRSLDVASLEMLSAGRFHDFARELWPRTSQPPYYVEAILDPFRPFVGHADRTSPALVTLLFKRERFEDAPGDKANRPSTPLDPLNLLDRGGRAMRESEALTLPKRIVYELIARTFRVRPAPNAPPERLTWGGANGRHSRIWFDRLRLELYNAAYAVDRADLIPALRAMAQGFATAGGAHTVFTLRFVSDAAGTLAFTRFPETVVVNMDGIRRAEAPRAAQAISLSLERADIAFSQHWGKQGAITPNRFHREFGAFDDLASRAARWRAARHRLLSPAMRAVLRNDLIVALGLE